MGLPSSICTMASGIVTFLVYKDHISGRCIPNAAQQITIISSQTGIINKYNNITFNIVKV